VKEITIQKENEKETQNATTKVINNIETVKPTNNELMYELTLYQLQLELQQLTKKIKAAEIKTEVALDGDALYQLTKQLESYQSELDELDELQLLQKLPLVNQDK